MARLSNHSNLPDHDLSLLNVQDSNSVAQKMLMLIEGVYGLGVKYSIAK